MKITTSYDNQPSLEFYNGPFYFRLWTNNQIVNLWVNDSNNLFPNSINLQLINWAKEEIEDSKSYTYKNSIRFFTTKSKEIYYLIDSLEITKIPNHNTIENWKKKGLHDNLLIIETKINGFYEGKSYPSYELNDDIEEGQRIISLISNLSSRIELKNYFSEFIKEIPLECYSNIESGTYCKGLSKKEKRKIKKRRKQYHKYRL